MTGFAADRNLLFGILALQMDFISRDQLVAAMHAWVLEKSTPLGELLVSKDALSHDRHMLLEALVKEHLAQHENDPEKSLASVSGVGSLGEELKQLGDLEVDASLAHVPQHSMDMYATEAQTMGAATSLGGRFRILRPFAKGGLGKVSVAEDAELHREVALKELQQHLADDPEKRMRFVVEAEITGGLEHPGIVPVYGLGQYDNGRPYYAMRFVRGDSLQEAIERFHREDARRRDPSEWSLKLRELLGRFIDVCNAIEYAHSRGVLHRDLKPGNVMLGNYGETLVVDWGLAKAVGRQTPSEIVSEPAIPLSSASESAPTQMGTAIGTPAFMSPEQAAGKIDLFGPASDVYSLGATLYSLLTGKPPVAGRDIGEILRRVQRGEIPRPREVSPSVPAPLEAICLKAMSLEPDRRYASPRELAQDVEHWLADERVSAYRDPMSARLARWARQHKTAMASVAALLVTAVIALTVGSILLKGANRRIEVQKGVAEDNAREAQSQRDLARENARLAKNNAQRAEREAAAAQLAQQREQQMREAAQRQTRIATAQRLAVQSRAEHDNLPQRSLLLAVEAMQTTMGAGQSPTPSAEQALRDALADTRGYVLPAQDFPVTVMATPDSRWLITGCRDNTVSLWDLTQRDPRTSPIVLRGHTKEIDHTAVSPDSHWLVTASYDDTLRFWDLTANDPAANPLVVGPLEDSASSMAISPDSRWLATASYEYDGRGTIRLWDVPEDAHPPSSIVLNDQVEAFTTLEFSADSRWLGAAIHNEDAIRLWDLTADDPIASTIVLQGSELEDLGVMRSPAISEPTTPPGPEGISPVPIEAPGPDDMAPAPPAPFLPRQVAPEPGQDAPERPAGRFFTSSDLFFSPDGRWIAADLGQTWIAVWDLHSADPLANPAVFDAGESIEARQFSPNGQWLVVQTRASLLQAWDLTVADSGARPLILSGHVSRVTSFTFTPDSHWLASTSEDKTARLWSLQTSDPSANCTVLRGHGDRVASATASANGRWLATVAYDGTARLWALTANDPSARGIVLRGPEPIEGGVRISSDGHWLMALCGAATVTVWDLWADDPAASAVVLRGHDHPVESLEVSPDGRWLATTARDENGARLWPLGEINQPAQPTLLREMGYVSSSGTGVRWCLTRASNERGSSSAFCLWNLHDKQPRMTRIPRKIAAATVSLNDQWLLTVAEDHRGHLWDLTASNPAEQVQVLRGHEHEIDVATYTSDGNWLATASYEEQTVLLWRLTAGVGNVAPIILQSPGWTINDLAFSADNRWLKVSSYDAFQLWDLRSERVGSRPSISSRTRPFTWHELSPDGRWLAATGPDGVQLWDLSKDDAARKSAVLPCGREEYFEVQFSPQSRWLAARGEREVCLWDLKSAEPTSPQIFDRVKGAPYSTQAFSSDDRWFALGSQDGAIMLRDLTKEQSAASARKLLGETDPIQLIDISADNRWLLAIGGARARLWDLTTEVPSPQPIPLDTDEVPVEIGSFSDNGRWLVTSNMEGRALLWSLANGTPDEPVMRLGCNWQLSSDNRRLFVGKDEDAESGTFVRGQILDLSTEDPAASVVTLAGDGSPVRLAGGTDDFRWIVTAVADLPDLDAHLWILDGQDDQLEPLLLPGLDPLESTEPAVMAIGPKCRWVATAGDDNTVRLWDIDRKDGRDTPLVLSGHTAPVTSITITPDSRWLVTASSDGTIRRWDLSSSQPIAEAIGKNADGPLGINLLVSPDARWLMTGDWDTGLGSPGKILLWDLQAEEPSQGPIQLAAADSPAAPHEFSPDSRWLTFWDDQGKVKLWDVTSSTPSQPISLPGAVENNDELEFSPDGQWVASRYSRNGIQLWRLKSLQVGEPFRLGKPNGESFFGGFSPNSHWLAGTERGKVVLWDLTAADPSANPIRLEGRGEGDRAGVFSPNSQLLATRGENNTIRIWSLTTDNPSANCRILRRQDEPLTSMAFHPNNQRLAVGYVDGTVVLYDLAEAAHASSPIVVRSGPLKLPGPEVAFSPDGHFLVLYDYTNAVAWEMRLHKLIQTARQAAGRKLTAEEMETYGVGDPR